MANHFVSTNKGTSGSLADLYNMTTGTSTTAGDDLELRVADGSSLSRKDVLLALDKFKRFIENPKVSSAFILNP